MAPIRIGIVGLGAMGLQHATYLHQGRGVEGALLAALCTRNPSRAAGLAQTFPSVPTFTNYAALLASKTCDAILIATPHTDHPIMIAQAFHANLQVLVEKPLAVSIQAARKIVADYAAFPHLKFGIMYNQRTNPLYQKIRDLLAANDLGTLTRITWIITNWFRPNAYYASSPWRATWKGEGGGVLINQSIHNLDLLQWLTNLMPSRITAIAARGKFHPIEVEDDVSAILEYAPIYPGEPALTAHFITTTGEHPGSNRLEIAGTTGRILCENNTLTFTQNLPDSAEFSRTTPLPFSTPQKIDTTFTFPANPLSEHQRLTQNFIDAIHQNLPNNHLLAPAPEGLRALELANALLLAGLTRTPIPLPLNPEQYESFLHTLRHPNT